jgi:hypothetical protein
VGAKGQRWVGARGVETKKTAQRKSAGLMVVVVVLQLDVEVLGFGGDGA